MMYAILALAGLALVAGIIFLISKMQNTAAQRQKEASEGQARADAAESTLKDQAAATAVEHQAREAGKKAASETLDPFDFS